MGALVTGVQTCALRSRGQRGLDLLVLHQGRRHVGEHRLAVADRAVEPAAVKPVTHRPCPFIPGLARETDCVAARQASPLLRRDLHARGEPIAPLPGQMPCARGEAKYGSSRRLASSSLRSEAHTHELQSQMRISYSLYSL